MLRFLEKKISDARRLQQTGQRRDSLASSSQTSVSSWDTTDNSITTGTVSGAAPSAQSPSAQSPSSVMQAAETSDITAMLLQSNEVARQSSASEERPRYVPFVVATAATSSRLPAAKAFYSGINPSILGGFADDGGHGEPREERGESAVIVQDGGSDEAGKDGRVDQTDFHEHSQKSTDKPSLLPTVASTRPAFQYRATGLSILEDFDFISPQPVTPATTSATIHTTGSRSLSQQGYQIPASILADFDSDDVAASSSATGSSTETKISRPTSWKSFFGNPYAALMSSGANPTSEPSLRGQASPGLSSVSSVEVAADDSR
jgi:hypothetical protein